MFSSVSGWMGDPSWSWGEWVVGCSGWVPSVTINVISNGVTLVNYSDSDVRDWDYSVFPQSSQPLVKNCQFGISGVNYSVFRN